ncbi:MAG: hypothetical protein AAGI03_02575 [Pseudomonadota bacterium]
MSYWNKLAGLALVGACLALPALADGRDRVVVQGPAPLQATTQTHCQSGQLIDGVCRTQTVTRTHTTTHRPTTVRRIVSQAPTPRRTVANAPQYDFSSFTGGVGTDIGTGFIGGGGRGIVVLGTGMSTRFSGVPGRAVAISRARGGCCH